MTNASSKPPSSKPIIFCADDFSLNPAINAGIFSLLELKRLSAVSCMTQSPTWPQDAETLKPWQGQVDIGLHFNLTQPFPNTFHIPLPVLMIQSHLRIPARQKIHDSFCQQLDAFEKKMGCAPDFIDGHQHVHFFPVLREIIVKEYLQRYGKTAQAKPYMRSLACLPADRTNLKAIVLQWMGAKTHDHLLRKNGIPRNTAFAGIYDFNPQKNLDKCMQDWLAALPEYGLVMCHPASDRPAAAQPDPIADARISEFQYLSSEQFIQTLEQQHSRLSRARL